ncbi:MAG: hypothetical protein ABGZ53_09575 [Fuerstiella sp.]
MSDDLLDFMRERTAEAAIDGGTLRKQGAPGVVQAARHFMKQIDLNSLSMLKADQFIERLDELTDQLTAAFPLNARNWGAARKAINIFLRDILYHRYLCDHFGLCHLEPWLEVPLDKDIALGLRAEPLGSQLPRWDTIKRLSKSDSENFQKCAQTVADGKNIARVHLDVIYWRNRP